MMNRLKAHKCLTFLIYIILILMAVAFMFPLYIAFINSFKPKSELFISVLQLPRTVTFDNYIKAFKNLQYIRCLINTLIVTVSSVIGIVFISSLAGYKLARVKGKVSNYILFFFVSAMIIPFQSIMITLMKVTMFLGINGTLSGLSMVYIGLGINMAIFLYHGFTKALPVEIDEAAYIDGCNQLQIFIKVIFPMLAPITSTIIIINAVFAWNDFLTAVIMLSNYKKYTLILSTRVFYTTYTVDWALLLAGIMIISLPIILFYLLFQKSIIAGITSGAVKG